MQFEKTAQLQGGFCLNAGGGGSYPRFVSSARTSQENFLPAGLFVVLYCGGRDSNGFIKKDRPTCVKVGRLIVLEEGPG